MKRSKFLFLFALLWATNASAATLYYNTAALLTGTGADAAHAKAASSIAADVLAASCGDNFYIAAGTTLSDTTDWLAITRTGCSTGSRLTIRMDPAEADSAVHPRVTGDWVPTAYDTGDAGIRLYENVDWVDIINIALRGYRVGLFTGDNTLSNGMSASNDADGKNNHIRIFSTAPTTNPLVWDQMQMGMVIYGVNNALCGPSTACDTTAEIVSGASGAWFVQGLNGNNFSHRFILIRNGAGDANDYGLVNGFIFDEIHCNGGGATYDKSGNQTGQGCFDIGQSSSSTGTPDSNVYVTNSTGYDLNNRLGDESAGNRNGDFLKTEPETNHIRVKGIGCWGMIDTCLDSKSVNSDFEDVVCAKSTHCFKSYSDLGAGKQTRYRNVLAHNLNNPGGGQASHSFQTFGDFYCENCTSVNLEEAGSSHFKFQGDFGNSKFTYKDSFLAQFSGFGTGLTNAPGVQYDTGSTPGNCNDYTCTFVNIVNGTTTTTVYPSSPSTVVMYDGEGGTTSGTDPGFGTMNPDYYDITDSAGCLPFQPTNVAYALLGFRCPGIAASTPLEVLAAPTVFSATATSDTTIDTSWTNPNATRVPEAPFQTGTAIRIETPTGGGFSTVHTDNEEMIVSGGFESTFNANTFGVEDSWFGLNLNSSGEVFSKNTADPYAGTNAQSMTVDTYDEGIYQLIAGTSNGVAYNSGCFVKTATPTYFKIKVQEGSGSFTVLASKVISVTNAWTWVEMPWTATATQPRLAIYGSSSITGNSGTVLVDGCSTAPQTLLSTYTVTGRTASTQYNLEVKAVNNQGSSTGSTDDATTTAATGGTGGAYALWFRAT